jgi:hypothetical protein
MSYFQFFMVSGLQPVAEQVPLDSKNNLIQEVTYGGNGEDTDEHN